MTLVRLDKQVLGVNLAACSYCTIYRDYIILTASACAIFISQTVLAKCLELTFSNECNIGPVRKR